MTFSKEVQIIFSLAVQEAQRRHHEYLTTEHILYAMLYSDDSQKIIINCGGDVDKIRLDLDQYFDAEMETVPEEEQQVPEQTAALQRVLQHAVTHCSAAGKDEVNTSDILVSILSEDKNHSTQLLSTMGIERLDVLNYISHGVGHQSQKPSSPDSKDAPEKKEKRPRKKSALESYTIDLRQRVRDGKIDPLIGRKNELQRTMQVLCRRRKNNPILVGEPGTGKTALAEGLATLFEEDNAPEILKGCRIYALDMGALLAGHQIPWRFRRTPQGGAERISRTGSNRFCSLMKSTPSSVPVPPPAVPWTLPTSSNRCWRRAKSAVSAPPPMTNTRLCSKKIRALSRRFQKIDVHEPSVDETVAILQGLRSHYEAFHNIRYSDEVLRAAAELADRYLTHRHLPDQSHRSDRRDWCPFAHSGQSTAVHPGQRYRNHCR